MKVRFSKDVMDRPEAFDTLDALIRFFQRQRHVWDVSNDDEIEKSSWLNSSNHSRNKNRIEFEKSLTASMKPPDSHASPHGAINFHKLSFTVEHQTVSSNQLSPDDAERALERPLKIAVEDAQNDGAFLETVIHAFQRTDLLDAHTEGWWEFEHMGGFGAVGHTVDRYLARNEGPIRLFVMVDCDREAGGLPSDTEEKVKKTCDPPGVPYHVLYKRKIENYVPLVVLEGLSRKDRRKMRRFRAYEGLSPEQQDFYEMKNGIKEDDDGTIKIDKKQRALFGSLQQATLQALVGGFGGNLHDCFSQNRAWFTRENLLAKCRAKPDELDKLLDRIESMI